MPSLFKANFMRTWLSTKQITTFVNGILLTILLIPALLNARPMHKDSLALLIDEVKNSQNIRIQSARKKLIVKAQKIIFAPDTPIFKRANDISNLADGKYRIRLDPKAKTLQEPNRTFYALAMADYESCKQLADELPLMAAAYRLGGQEIFKTRVLSQLEEMVTWSPLQRPGWSLGKEGASLPESGYDGCWLATGYGIRALADTLEIMPPQDIPTKLHDAIKILFLNELQRGSKDFVEKPQDFIKENDYTSLGWIFVNEAVLRTCAALGGNLFRDEYQESVFRFRRSFASAGRFGSWPKGYTQSIEAIPSLLSAGRAITMRGDSWRSQTHYLHRFTNWHIDHMQPGYALANKGDASEFHPIDFDNPKLRAFYCMLAAATQAPSAHWVLTKHFNGPTDDLYGLLTTANPLEGELEDPPRYTKYEKAATLHWRSGWTEFASSIWIRGGDKADANPQADRGHLNFIAKGTPILIEAGNPPPSLLNPNPFFRSVTAHNVLQIDDFPALPAPAKIFLTDMNNNSGDLSVRVNEAYPEANAWIRTLSWENLLLRVEDKVQTKAPNRHYFTFRWHLGTGDNVDLKRMGPKQYIITWPHAEIDIRGSSPIIVDQLPYPDYTLIQDNNAIEPASHTCIEVKSKSKLSGITVVTVIKAR